MSSFESEEEMYSYDIEYDTSGYTDYSSPPPTLDELFPEDQTRDNDQSPPPVVADDDPNIAFSISINQSRQFLENSLKIPIKEIKRHHIPGFVILRLEDFSTIRNVSKIGRAIPHLVIGPPPNKDWLSKHPDFAACYNMLILQFPATTSESQ